MKKYEQHSAKPTQRILILTALSVFVAGWFPALAGAAVTYEVDRFDDNLAASGCTGAANDCSLRGAISAANNDGQATTIVLPDGTYQLTIAGADEDYNQTGDLDIREALEITAAPGATPVIEQTVTDRVLETFNAIGDLTIRGPMTITGGNIVSSPDSGGLIRVHRSGSLTLEDVSLEDGHTIGLGGCLNFSAPTVAGSLSLTNVTLSGCSSEAYGGGLNAEIGDSSAIFDQVVIEDNRAGPGGGGVSFSSASTTVVFIDSTIQNNIAEHFVDGYGYGGGVHIAGGAPVRFERSTIARNRAGEATGGGGYGGGIHIEGSNVILRNSTVSSNVVDGSVCGGSAIRVSGASSTLLVEQSTIVGDPASSLAWSAVELNANGAVTFEGSIVEGGCYILNQGTFTSNGFNVERPLDGSVTTQCGLTNQSDVLTSNPFLKPLAGYGGPTATHALLPGAPAIWLVASTYCQDTDQRLAPRVSLFCDAGSYESNGQPPGIWIFNDGFESGDTAAW